MRMPETRYAIGMTVCCIRGQLSNNKRLLTGMYTGRADYFYVKELLDGWCKFKKYYASKKHHSRFAVQTMFGETHREMIDGWLTVGYAIERELKNLVEALKHTARH